MYSITAYTKLKLGKFNNIQVWSSSLDSKLLETIFLFIFIRYKLSYSKVHEVYSWESFYRHIPWVTILGQDTEIFHYARNFPGVPSL